MVVVSRCALLLALEAGRQPLEQLLLLEELEPRHARNLQVGRPVVRSRTALHPEGIATLVGRRGPGVASRCSLLVSPCASAEADAC